MGLRVYSQGQRGGFSMQEKTSNAGTRRSDSRGRMKRQRFLEVGELPTSCAKGSGGHMPQSSALLDIALWMGTRLDVYSSASSRTAGGAMPVRLGTMFSGTDVPAVAFRCVLQSIAQLGATHGREVAMEHVFSCESVPGKQKWIKAMPRPPRRLYRDARDLENAMAWCVIAGALVEVESVDVLVAGFSCVSMSDQNKDRLRFRQAMVDGDLANAGETGKTLMALLSYIEKTSRKPWGILLENVRGLVSLVNAADRPIDTVHKRLQAYGYETHHCLVNSSEFMFPHKRQRVYIVALLPGSAALGEWKVAFDESLRLLQPGEYFPLNDFLSRPVVS